MPVARSLDFPVPRVLKLALPCDGGRGGAGLPGPSAQDYRDRRRRTTGTVGAGLPGPSAQGYRDRRRRIPHPAPPCVPLHATRTPARPQDTSPPQGACRPACRAWPMLGRGVSGVSWWRGGQVGAWDSREPDFHAEPSSQLRSAPAGKPAPQQRLSARFDIRLCTHALPGRCARLVTTRRATSALPAASASASTASSALVSLGARVAGTAKRR
jgi:hypothetical protein